MNITIEIPGIFPLTNAIIQLADAIAGAKTPDTRADLSTELAYREALAEHNKLHGTPTEKAGTSTKPRTKKAVAPEPDPTLAAGPTATATKNASQTTTESPSSTPEGPSLKDLQTEILRVAREKGHDAAAALLAQFGARKVSEVKPEDGARLIAAAKEI